jgi:hypothetical protein
MPLADPGSTASAFVGGLNGFVVHESGLKQGKRVQPPMNADAFARRKRSGSLHNAAGAFFQTFGHGKGRHP